MPKPNELIKALLQEIEWDKDGQVTKEGRKVKVQFNPETLKVSLSNQVAGGDQRGGAAIQFSGRGTTKLSFDLWFDVTAPDPDRPEETDVRRLTKQIADFMKVTEKKGTGKKAKSEYVPPGVRLLWGTFLFEGVMESMNETLEFFSEEGKPLRASVSVSLMKQDTEIRFPPEPTPDDPNAPPPGTTPQQQAQEGDSVQSLAARDGRPEDWQDIARDNDIEDPLRVPVGTPVDTGSH